MPKLSPRFISNYPWFHKRRKPTREEFEEATRLKQIIDREDYPVGYIEKVQNEQFRQHI